VQPDRVFGTEQGSRVSERFSVCVPHGDSDLYVHTGGFTRDVTLEVEHSRDPVTLLERDGFIRLLLEDYEVLDPEYKASPVVQDVGACRIKKISIVYD